MMNYRTQQFSREYPNLQIMETFGLTPHPRPCFFILSFKNFGIETPQPHRIFNGLLIGVGWVMVLPVPISVRWSRPAAFLLVWRYMKDCTMSLEHLHGRPGGGGIDIFWHGTDE